MRRSGGGAARHALFALHPVDQHAQNLAQGVFLFLRALLQRVEALVDDGQAIAQRLRIDHLTRRLNAQLRDGGAQTDNLDAQFGDFIARLTVLDRG